MKIIIIRERCSGVVIFSRHQERLLAQLSLLLLHNCSSTLDTHFSRHCTRNTLSIAQCNFQFAHSFEQFCTTRVSTTDPLHTSLDTANCKLQESMLHTCIAHIVHTAQNDIALCTFSQRFLSPASHYVAFEHCTPIHATHLALHTLHKCIAKSSNGQYTIQYCLPMCVLLPRQSIQLCVWVCALDIGCVLGVFSKFRCWVFGYTCAVCSSIWVLFGVFWVYSVNLGAEILGIHLHVQCAAPSGCCVISNISPLWLRCKYFPQQVWLQF